jgi:hypothetical protein
MSAASSEVGLVCEGALLRVWCHELRRVVNNLTMPILEICLQIFGIHRLGHLLNTNGFVALEEPRTCP